MGRGSHTCKQDTLRKGCPRSSNLEGFLDVTLFGRRRRARTAEGTAHAQA